LVREYLSESETPQNASAVVFKAIFTI